MRVWPLIVRELRTEARHAVNHWSRVLGAATAILAFDFLLRRRGFFSSPADLGIKLFTDLTTVTFGALALLVPLFTADCLSREKREGTLGLLFLTPMTAREIVVSKCLVHALRGVVVCLAILPVMCIPLLLGGVTSRILLLTLLGDTSILLLALGSGVLASAWSRQRVRALILAEMIGALSLLLSEVLLFCMFIFQVAIPYLPQFRGQRLLTLEWLFGGIALYSGQAVPSLSFRMPREGIWVWIGVNAAMAMVSFLYLWLSVRLAARRIRQSWQEEPPSPRQLWWGRTFCTPLFWRRLFRQKLGRLLERNPVVWLYSHSWSHRLSKWGWALAAVVAQFAPAIFGSEMRELMEWQLCVLFALAAGLAFSTARSFVDERQSGTMELLLVTPLRASRVVNGRLQALWQQFLPAFGILLGVWLVGCATDAAGNSTYLAAGWEETVRPLYWFQIASTFIAVPVVGLALSLEGIPWTFNWLITLLTTLLWPYPIGFGLVALASLVIEPTHFLAYHVRPDFFSFWPAAVSRLGMAALAWWFACHNLERRRFIKGWRKPWNQRIQGKVQWVQHRCRQSIAARREPDGPRLWVKP